MRKSLPLLSTLILTASGLGLVNTMPASAIVETPEGETLYTIEDVRAMNTEMDALIAENCGTDLMDCGRNYYDNKLYTEPKYRPLELYLNSNIMITSLTPNTGQLKLYYNNIDGMSRWYGPSTRELISLHLAWTDLSREESSETFPFTPALSELETVPEWYHFIYSSAPGANDTTIIPGAETTIQSITPDMRTVTNGGGIQFTTEEIGGGFSSGWFSVDSCLNSPHYKDGMECRLAFTENYHTQFIPYKNGVPAWLAPETTEEDNATDDNPVENNVGNTPSDTSQSEYSPDNTKIIYVTTTSSTSDISIPSTTSTPTSRNIVSVAESTTGPVTVSTSDEEKAIKDNQPSSTSQDTNLGSADNNFSVPLSGEGQTACVTEFPWWFIALVLGIDAVIMFILWPRTRQPKTQN